MTVLLTQELPVSREDLEAVSNAMGVSDNPPDGLLLHVCTATSQGIRVVDVWESTAHYDRFREERLMPIMGKVMAERGISLDGPPPEPEFSDAFDVVRGRA